MLSEHGTTNKTYVLARGKGISAPVIRCYDAGSTRKTRAAAQQFRSAVVYVPESTETHWCPISSESSRGLPMEWSDRGRFDAICTPPRGTKNQEVVLFDAKRAYYKSLRATGYYPVLPQQTLSPNSLPRTEVVSVDQENNNTRLSFISDACQTWRLKDQVDPSPLYLMRK